jgi:hypothetical protein
MEGLEGCTGIYFYGSLLNDSTEATFLDWKSLCLENPSVPLQRLADKKSRV